MKIRKILLSGLLMLGMVMVFLSPASATPAQAAPGVTKIYNLFATDGYISMADGTSVYIYGYVGGQVQANQSLPMTYLHGPDMPLIPDALANQLTTIPVPDISGGQLTADQLALQGHAQFPGPMIYGTTNDVFEIRLKNLGVANSSAPNDPHSIHLHGLDVEQANDGVPETSVAVVPANQCVDGSYDNVNVAGGPTPPCSGPSNVPGFTSQGGLVQGAGNVVVYMFAPKVAATYFYHCHQEADIHVQMGMMGAIVIYNPSDPQAKYGPNVTPPSGKIGGGSLYGWHYDNDVVLLLDEFDLRQHTSEESTYQAAPGDPGYCGPGSTITDPTQCNVYNPVAYKPQYWFINGLSFPNTVHVSLDPSFDWGKWITAHPGYDPLIVGSSSLKHPGTRFTNGTKYLIRMINMGFETQPMHMHGFHGKVIGSDQRAWFWANLGDVTPVGLGDEKNTLTIGSGETYEWLIDMGTQKGSSNYSPTTAGLPASTYPGGTQSRYDPATGNPISNTVVLSDPSSPTGENNITAPNGDSYLGGPTITGSLLASDTGQYFVFHNHDDYKATNNGTYPGGMFTVIKVLP
jgi:manganese oxidase